MRNPASSKCKTKQDATLGKESRGVQCADGNPKECKDPHDNCEPTRSKMLIPQGEVLTCSDHACTGMDMRCALAKTDILGDAAEGGCRDIHNNRTYSLYKYMHVESGAQPARMQVRTNKQDIQESFTL